MNSNIAEDEPRKTGFGGLRWKDVAELVGLAALTISVVVLIYEVRANTEVINYQAKMDSVNSLADPFFESETLSGVLAKIKEVDGFPPPIPAYMETYEMSAEEAILWTRHMIVLWGGIEAIYLAYGPSPQLEQRINVLLTNQDNRIYVGQRAALTASKEFLDYIRDVQARAGEPQPFSSSPENSQ
ncbi:MAG: hypothetical protein R3348_08170 [Xanthomonadales bacterium]|nr:hypothetical protein [Xanthomonadales bacterium]